jgi:hypothetical protein
MDGGHEKVLIAAPCGWARRRRFTERQQGKGAGAQARSCWQAKFPIDASKLLPVMKQHAKTYRVPIIAGFVLAAGVVAVAVGTHAWHVQPVVPGAVQVADEARPAVAVVSAPGFAGVTSDAVVSTPARTINMAKRMAPSRSTLGLADDGTIVVVAQPRDSHADGFNLDITSPGSLWAKMGARYRVDPVLIYAVALVETRGLQPDGSVAPSPWIVRINGHLHSGTRAETEHAIELAHLLAVPVQDVGIMQVYYPVHRDIEPDPIALLNPARNIDIGTRLLRKAMKETSDPVLRIGYYHSHDETLARGYGQLVLNVYRELKLAMGNTPAQSVAMESAADTASHPGG